MGHSALKQTSAGNWSIQAEWSVGYLVTVDECDMLAPTFETALRVALRATGTLTDQAIERARPLIAVVDGLYASEINLEIRFIASAPGYLARVGDPLNTFPTPPRAVQTLADAAVPLDKDATTIFPASAYARARAS